ncbi:hypothetical protein [Maribellus maritimus]|uniref:hypothetical protein n=1 Tax=Maribellus maritimus TaxID=2870838 RepID=UPI001EECAF80|nr:hypothetical protein [Maribellus maritimus]MCG6186435.1 hypothetical protein [Maribellus maritimus]
MDNLKENTPELSKIKKENPFRVPENYFDDFSARLQMKIEAEKKVVPGPKRRIIQLLKPAISLAASFALIFLLVYWPLKSFLPGKFAESNTIEIESYDNENQYLTLLEGIDENSFYALIDEPSATVEFSDDELINYINTNMSEYDIYLGTDN